MELNAFHTGLDHVGIGLGVQGNDNSLIHHDLLGIVHSAPAGLGIGDVGAGGAVGDDGIVAGVAPQTVVVVTVGDPHIQVGHGVGVVGAPAGQADLIVAVLDVGNTLLLGLDLDVQGHAGQSLLNLILDNGGHILGLGLILNQQLELEGIGAQLGLGGLVVGSGLGGIVGAHIAEHGLVGGEVGAVGAGGELGRNSGVGGNGAVLHHVVNDGHAVHGIRKSQTHILVVQSGHVVHVQSQIPQVAGAGDRQLGIALNLLDLVAGQLDDIQIAVLIAHVSLLAVLDNLIVQAVQLDLVSVVVVGVLSQGEAQSRGLIAGQDKSAVAQNRLGAGAEGAVGQTLKEGLIDRVEGGEVHQAQEVADGNLQSDLQSLAVEGLDAQLALVHLAVDDGGGVLDLADVAEHIAVLGSQSGINGPLPCEDEVVSGHRLAVGPVGILPQVEGVDSAVLAHIPALGNGGDGGAVGVHLGQTVGIVGDDLKAGAVGGDLRIQAFHLDLDHHVQNLVAFGSGGGVGRSRVTGIRGSGSGSGSAGSRAAAGSQAQHHDHCQNQSNDSFHVHVSFSFLFDNSP